MSGFTARLQSICIKTGSDAANDLTLSSTDNSPITSCGDQVEAKSNRLT